MIDTIQFNRRGTISIFLVILSLVSLGMKLIPLSIFFLFLLLALSFDKLGRGFVFMFKKIIDVMLSLVVMTIFIYIVMLILVYFFT